MITRFEYYNLTSKDQIIILYPGRLIVDVKYSQRLEVTYESDDNQVIALNIQHDDSGMIIRAEREEADIKVTHKFLKSEHEEYMENNGIR